MNHPWHDVDIGPGAPFEFPAVIEIHAPVAMIDAERGRAMAPGGSSTACRVASSPSATAGRSTATAP